MDPDSFGSDLLPLRRPHSIRTSVVPLLTTSVALMGLCVLVWTPILTGHAQELAAEGPTTWAALKGMPGGGSSSGTLGGGPGHPSQCTVRPQVLRLTRTSLLSKTVQVVITKTQTTTTTTTLTLVHTDTTTVPHPLQVTSTTISTAGAVTTITSSTTSVSTSTIVIFSPGTTETTSTLTPQTTAQAMVVTRVVTQTSAVSTSCLVTLFAAFALCKSQGCSTPCPTGSAVVFETTTITSGVGTVLTFTGTTTPSEPTTTTLKDTTSLSVSEEAVVMETVVVATHTMVPVTKTEIRWVEEEECQEEQQQGGHGQEEHPGQEHGGQGHGQQHYDLDDWRLQLKPSVSLVMDSIISSEHEPSPVLDSRVAPNTNP